MRHYRFLSFILLLVFSGTACQDEGEAPGERSIRFPEDKAFEKLSDYNLYTGEAKKLTPSERLLPYDLNSELFSDYALKQRFVYIPPGEKASFKSNTEIEFPKGSILVKNFYYNKANGTSAEKMLIETRLLINYEAGWQAETYVWNEEQTEAYLQRAGDRKSISWQDQEGQIHSTNYIIPNKNECKGCHAENGKLIPVGPKPFNLNRQYNYVDGTENQLTKWSKEDMLDGLHSVESVDKLPVWHDASTGTLEQRARAYLEVNCANCHSAKGPANNSGLFLDYYQTESTRIGICKPPVAAGSGSGNLKYAIVPGKPDESILVFRMESTDAQIRMPEVGRTMIHEEGVALIKEWIRKMENSGCN